MTRYAIVIDDEDNKAWQGNVQGARRDLSDLVESYTVEYAKVISVDVVEPVCKWCLQLASYRRHGFNQNASAPHDFDPE